MKKARKYLINPPFALVVANPKGKRAAKKRRNPTKARRGRAGIFVIRKPSRNPSAPLPAMKTKRRRKHRSKRRNPAKLRHVLMLNPKRKTRRRRRARSKIFASNPMKTKHRRRGKRRRSRNPMMSRRGVRRSGRRRSSTRRFRNPMPAIASQLFGPDMLTLAGGVVIANVGTTMIMNRLVAGNPTTGVRPFNLPGVDYSMLGTAAAPTFYTKPQNVVMLALYKGAIGATAGYLLRNQSPRLSRGILVGTVATMISDVLKGTKVLSSTGTLTWGGMGRNYPAMGRNFRAGTGFLPGTSTRFTGPGQNFLTANNVPRPRGMGAVVGPNMVRNTAAMAESAFGAAN